MRRLVSTSFSKMSAKVKDVDIDPTGVFKYILINLSTEEPNGAKSCKEIVRGYKDCKYHTHINDKLTQELENLKKTGDLVQFEAKVLGGGKINHDPDAKSLKVYSISTGYGKADHKVSVEVLKKVFPNYNILWSDEE